MGHPRRRRIKIVLLGSDSTQTQGQIITMSLMIAEKSLLVIGILPMILDQFDLMLSYLAFMVIKEAEFGIQSLSWIRMLFIPDASIGVLR